MNHNYIVNEGSIMELENFRNFLAIIEAEGFTEASSYVEVEQPALSRQLKAIENYFGTKLLIASRGSRNLILTDAGRILYQKAKYICALEDLAKKDIETSLNTKTLKISSTNVETSWLIKLVLKDFRQLCPQVDYKIQECSPSNFIHNLISGESEFGFLNTSAPNENSLDIIFSHKLELSAVFHKDSPWRGNDSKAITLEDLADIPLSIPASCSFFLKECYAKASLTPHILSICTNYETVLQWPIENLAAAIIPVSSKETLHKDLIIKKITNIKRPFYKTIVKLKNRSLPKVAQKFLDFYSRRVIL